MVRGELQIFVTRVGYIPFFHGKFLHRDYITDKVNLKSFLRYMDIPGEIVSEDYLLPAEIYFDVVNGFRDSYRIVYKDRLSTHNWMVEGF